MIEVRTFTHERTPAGARRIVAAIMACVFAWPLAAAQGGGTPTMPLELIVKFSNDSEAGRRVDRLVSEGSGDLGGLAEAEATLEAATGVPLTRERVTSGREILFSIPERPLLERVDTRAARRADVASTQLDVLQGGNPRLPGAQLVIRFRDSSDAFDTLERARHEGGLGEGVRALTDEIATASGVPVTGTAQPQGMLSLVVDRQALLETLSARVNALDDVDYAQPNATMQILK